MVDRLFRSYKKERSGAEYLTAKTMDLETRDWLYIEGFTEQHRINALALCRWFTVQLAFACPQGEQQSTEGPSEGMVSKRAEGNVESRPSMGTYQCQPL
jgi:hypothetical protein